MWIIVYMLVFSWDLVSGSNVLIIHPVYSGSHHIVMKQFGDYLVTRGHTVTQVKFQQANRHSSPDTNVTVIDLKIRDRNGECTRYINPTGKFDLRTMASSLLFEDGHNLNSLPIDIFCLTKCHCDTLFGDPALYARLNASRFDVAVVDLIANECGLALVKALDLPVATFWGFSFQGGEVSLTSAFNPPSIVPGFFSRLHARMSFFERVFNFLLVCGHRVMLTLQLALAQSYVSARFPDLPPLEELVHKTDIHLLNVNFITESPRLLTPNMKHIGGPHLREGKPLSEVRKVQKDVRLKSLFLSP